MSVDMATYRTAMDTFIESLQDSVARFSTAVRAGPIEAPVRGCPGWDLAELTRHLGFVQRWARLATVTSAPPDVTQIDAAPAAADATALADWFDAGAAALIDAFGTLDPNGPTWHPFPVARLGKVWPRRQAHEAFVHAWDAEEAIGAAGPMEPAMAADGIAEYFEVIVPRVITKSQRAAPVGTLAVVCTDARFHDGSDRIVVRVDDPFTVVIDPTATPTSELSGRAEDLSLALWGRRPLASASTDALAVDWLSYGGN